MRWILPIIMLLHTTAIAGERVFTLDDAYQAALRTSESVKIAQEGVVQSEAVVDQAWTYLYPRLYGDAGYTRYNEVLPPSAAPGSPIFQPLDQVTAGLLLSQPLYTGGRTLAALRTAMTLRETSKLNLSRANQDLMLNVAAAYYGVLKAQKFVEASRGSVERMERNRKVTEREARVRRTRANASALLRANTLVSSARVLLLQSEDRLRVAKRNLSLLTGLPETAEFVEPDLLPVPEDEYESLLSRAFANREDYAGARLGQDIASENVTIVRGAHFPQLYAEAGLRYKDADPDTMDEGTIYYGGVRFSVPLFEGGLMSARMSEARSQVRQAELSTSLLKRTIEQEVYQAQVDLQTTRSVISLVRQQHADARENFTVVEGLYAEGLASGLQLIDAEQALLFAERAYLDVLYDQQVAILKLRRAIGLLGKEENSVKEVSHAAS